MKKIKNKTIFLDKDGTLVKNIPYNIDISKIELELGVIRGLKILKDRGFIFVVVTNQSGVARGLFNEEDLLKVYEKLDNLLKLSSIKIRGYYHCPHHPDGLVKKYSINCVCRKPKSGLLISAAKDLNIDLSESWMIGDILDDVEAGNNAGCKTALVDNGGETEWILNKYRNPNLVANNFFDAARKITKEHERDQRRFYV